MQEKKIHIFERLAYADTFERFLGNKYNTAKRFGLDGSEAVIPGASPLAFPWDFSEHFCSSIALCRHKQPVSGRKDLSFCRFS